MNVKLVAFTLCSAVLVSMHQAAAEDCRCYVGTKLSPECEEKCAASAVHPYANGALRSADSILKYIPPSFAAKHHANQQPPVVTETTVPPPTEAALPYTAAPSTAAPLLYTKTDVATSSPSMAPSVRIADSVPYSVGQPAVTPAATVLSSAEPADSFPYYSSPPTTVAPLHVEQPVVTPAATHFQQTGATRGADIFPYSDNQPVVTPAATVFSPVATPAATVFSPVVTPAATVFSPSVAVRIADMFPRSGNQPAVTPAATVMRPSGATLGADIFPYSANQPVVTSAATQGVRLPDSLATEEIESPCPILEEPLAQCKARCEPNDTLCLERCQQLFPVGTPSTAAPTLVPSETASPTTPLPAPAATTGSIPLAVADAMASLLALKSA